MVYSILPTKQVLLTIHSRHINGPVPQMWATARMQPSATNLKRGISPLIVWLTWWSSIWVRTMLEQWIMSPATITTRATLRWWRTCMAFGLMRRLSSWYAIILTCRSVYANFNSPFGVISSNLAQPGCRKRSMSPKYRRYTSTSKRMDTCITSTRREFYSTTISRRVVIQQTSDIWKLQAISCSGRRSSLDGSLEPPDPRCSMTPPIGITKTATNGRSSLIHSSDPPAFVYGKAHSGRIDNDIADTGPQRCRSW